MAKKSGMMQRLQLQRDKRDAEVRHHTHVYVLDMVTVALGRLGWGEKRLREFDAMMTQVSKDYAELIIADSQDDREMVYAKSVLDRELQRYTGSMFIPYDERYK